MKEANALSDILEEYLYENYRKAHGQFEARLDDLREALADGEIPTKEMQKEMSLLREDIYKWIRQNYKDENKVDFMKLIAPTKVDELDTFEAELNKELRIAESELTTKSPDQPPPIPSRFKRKETLEKQVQDLEGEIKHLEAKFQKKRHSFVNKVTEELEVQGIVEKKTGVKKVLGGLKARVSGKEELTDAQRASKEFRDIQGALKDFQFGEPQRESLSRVSGKFDERQRVINMGLELEELSSEIQEKRKNLEAKRQLIDELNPEKNKTKMEKEKSDVTDRLIKQMFVRRDNLISRMCGDDKADEVTAVLNDPEMKDDHLERFRKLNDEVGLSDSETKLLDALFCSMTRVVDCLVREEDPRKKHKEDCALLEKYAVLPKDGIAHHIQHLAALDQKIAMTKQEGPLPHTHKLTPRSDEDD